MAAWFRFLALPRPPAPDLVDPLAPHLLGPAAAGDVDALIDAGGVFPAALRGDAPTRAAIPAAVGRKGDAAGVRALLDRC